MAYKHGIYGSELATSLLPPTKIANPIVVFGTAPVHLAADPVKANEPIMCSTYAQAVQRLGYSDDWKKYSICESINTLYSLYPVAPVVFINVLDTDKHIETVEDKTVEVDKGIATVDEAVIISTLKVTTNDGDDLVLGNDYVAAYDDDERLTVTAIDGGAMTVKGEIKLSYSVFDASKVTTKDIVGGADLTTGKNEGMELIEEIYPRFGVIPGIVIAPGWSQKPAVAAVMKAKCSAINGRFKAVAIADIDTAEAKKSTDVYAWKNKNNFIDNQLVICWPKVKMGDNEYWLSTHAAGVFAITDSEHEDVPYWPPSNQNCQIDSAVVGDNEIYMGLTEVNVNLGGNGVVSVLNENGWKLWGNYTSAYPGTTDVKDTFIPIRRMFNWVNNTLITTFWSRIDNPLNKRFINTVVDSANDWLNGLANRGFILGGRVEFLENENSQTDLMSGIAKFHVYLTPCSPAQEIDFIMEYDVSYTSTLFS